MNYSTTRLKNQSKYIKTASAASMALLLAFGMTTSAFALTNVVYPTDTMGWTNESSGGGTINYGENAPESFGYGSLYFKTNATNTATAMYSHDVDQPLNAITTLSYYTSKVASNTAGGSAAMFVDLDLNNDGEIDASLVYEPYLQNGGNTDAAPVVANDWQQWEASGGLFWSLNSYSGALNLVEGVNGSPLYTLSQIRAAYPNAQLASFGVGVGANHPNSTILVDGITVNETVYDFEGTSSPEPGTDPDPDPDPTHGDNCKKNGWMRHSRSNENKNKNERQNHSSGYGTGRGHSNYKNSHRH